MDVYSVFVFYPLIILITAVFAWIEFFKAWSTHKKLSTLEKDIKHLKSQLEDSIKLHKAERKQEDLPSAPEPESETSISMPL
jgi:hypothetical protein